MKKQSKGSDSKQKISKKETLHDLLIVKLQALYDTENQLVKALPKMAKKATDSKLKEGFELQCLSMFFV